MDEKFIKIQDLIFDFYSDLTYDQILLELEIIGGRLSVLEVPKLLKLKGEDRLKIIVSMIEDESSKQSLDFIEKVEKADLLETLMESNFKVLVSHLQSVVNDTEEILVQSPGVVSQKARRDIEKRLESFHKNKFRIVYQINEELVSGVLVKYNGDEYDYSLKSNSHILINNLLAKVLEI